MRQGKSTFILLLLLVTSGCSGIFGTSKGDKKYPSLILADYTRGQNFEVQKMTLNVNRDDLKNSLSRRGAFSGVRLVELLRGKDELVAGYPEYRIFGIRPDSVYSLLGLENADVIIAANGYIIDSPGKFPKYVSLLSEEKGGEVIIRRGGELLELRYLLS